MLDQTSTPTIKIGDYLVVQRQKYIKLQKFGSIDAIGTLGKDQFELRGLLNHPYNATFKMSAKESSTGDTKKNKRHQRVLTLELCSDSELRNIREVLGINSSGDDNRNICDDGESQTLRPEEIEQLREECTDSAKIIEKIVENSKTFHTRTEYSQDKYLRKKEKKYFEFVQIRQPTIRLIAEIYFRQSEEKVLGIRCDTLSQIISYTGVSAYGNYLLYESGTGGLLPASMLNAIGAGTEGHLVHMHPGNDPQITALLALNLPEEQLKRHIAVNIYSVLRAFYQKDEEVAQQEVKEVENVEEAKPEDIDAAEVMKEAANEAHAEEEVTESGAKEADIEEPSSKKPRLSGSEDVPPSTALTEASTDSPPRPPSKWQLENRRACELMAQKFDSLLIASKEHPSNILQALLPFVKPSRPVVIFNQSKELLMELYVELKGSSKVTNLHLTSNWLRIYQILPNRTHPEVNMNGNSGYLLTGYTLSS